MLSFREFHQEIDRDNGFSSAGTTSNDQDILLAITGTAGKSEPCFINQLLVVHQNELLIALEESNKRISKVF